MPDISPFFATPTQTAPLPAFEMSPIVGALLALLQSCGALVAVKDMLTGRYTFANTLFADFVGRSPEQVVGHTDIEILPLADAAAMRAADHRALAAGLPSEDEHRFERGDGKHEFRATRMAIGSDAAPQLVQVWWDETASRHAHSQTMGQLQQALKQIERQQGALEHLRAVPAAAPTELFRSDHFDEHARRELALSSREHREFAVVLLLLDRSAALEQRFGAGAVKHVMDAVGQILRTNTRAMDVISRVGTDRYAILLSGVGLATAYTRMEQMRRQCATHIVVHEGHPLGFEVSVGIASFPHTSDLLDTLSAAAEHALREAVRRGGNRVALAPVPLGQRSELAAA
jgi:diguanylate cyclase (GGDEF)-like protein